MLKFQESLERLKKIVFCSSVEWWSVVFVRLNSIFSSSFHLSVFMKSDWTKKTAPATITIAIFGRIEHELKRQKKANVEENESQEQFKRNIQ